MSNINGFLNVVILWINIYDYGPIWINGQTIDHHDSLPEISMFAMKMKGTCPKPDLVEDYIKVCPQSAITLEDDVNFHTYHPKLPINTVLKLKGEKDMVMNELIRRALYHPNVQIHHPKFGRELLNSVMAIYAKACPVVPPTFLQTVYHLFSHLHFVSAHNRKEYLPRDQQKWITKIMNNCTVEAKLPQILTDFCRETVFNMRDCKSFICTNKEQEFRLFRTDPIADVVFKTMEMVQSVCFPFFHNSYRMFHFFHLAIMDMFTDEIKTRWATQLEDTVYWKRLLGPSYETHLINIERCNEGIIANMKFHYRISRNSLPARLRLEGRIKSDRVTG